MGLIDRIKKRLTGGKTRVGTKASVFNYNNSKRYNANNSTWLDMYVKEPFIHGAIDSKVNAIVGEWTIESASKSPTKAEIDLVERIKVELSEPSLNLVTKLRTIAYRMIIDTVVYVETARGDMNFYILNPEECKLAWDESEKYIEGIKWSKDRRFKDGNYILLSKKKYAFASMFEPDTNLFEISPMETIIDIANLLSFARKYNLNIFEKGGVPAMLFSLPESTSVDEFNRFKFMLENSKSGSNLISIGDIKAQPLAGFTKDMEYDKLVDHGIQSIMSLLQVSPQMMSMGASGKGGGESARQEMNAFSIGVHNIQNIIDNLMTQILYNLYSDDEEDLIDTLPRRGRPNRNPAKNVRFKLKKWVDKRQQSAIHKIYLDTQVLTPNEVRADLGREPVEWGDEPIKSAGSMGNTGSENPIGQPDRGDETSGSDENEQDSASRESDSQEAERR